jgi:hypothetical protein
LGWKKGLLLLLVVVVVGGLTWLRCLFLSRLNTDKGHLFTHAYNNLLMLLFLQNWIPTFLASFGGSGQGIAVTGGLSSIPWVAAAVVGPLVGQWAKRLIQDNVMSQLAVRRLMQVTCFLGCAASVVPLALVKEPSVTLAVACLTGSLALYRYVKVVGRCQCVWCVGGGGRGWKGGV